MMPHGPPAEPARLVLWELLLYSKCHLRYLLYPAFGSHIYKKLIIEKKCRHFLYNSVSLHQISIYIIEMQYYTTLSKVTNTDYSPL